MADIIGQPARGRVDGGAGSSADARQLVAYFGLTYAISWSIAIPLALAEQGIIRTVLPEWLFVLVSCGPMLSALIVTGISQGVPGLKELGGRMFYWRVCPKWWVISFSPLILGFLAVWLLNGLVGGEPAGSTLVDTTYLPSQGLGLLFLSIFGLGLGQETGWRGFALPRLKKGRSALRATMIVAFFWALWYWPQFFYLLAPSSAAGWATGLLAGAVVLTWLYNSANRSILMVAIWHGSFSFMIASQADLGPFPAVMVVLATVMAVVVMVRTKPKHLMSI